MGEKGRVDARMASGRDGIYGFLDIVISAEKTLVQVRMLMHRTVPSLNLSHDLQQLDNTVLSVLSLSSISALNCDGRGSPEK